MSAAEKRRLEERIDQTEEELKEEQSKNELLNETLKKAKAGLEQVMRDYTYEKDRAKKIEV